MPLRRLVEEDLLLILQWRNSLKVRKNMYSSHKISEAEHRAWFERIIIDQQSRWYIHYNSKNVSDGVVYFTKYLAEHRSAFWGFYMGTEAKRGAGIYLGIDALNEAFGTLGLDKLSAEVLSTNEKSLLFHKKLGFFQEGFFRDAHFKDGKYIDIIRFGMLKKDWHDSKTKILRQHVDEK